MDETQRQIKVLDIGTILSRLNDHQTLPELEDAIRQVVAAVKATGLRGSVSLELQIVPTSKNENAQGVLIDDAVRVKMPKFKHATSMFFADENGRLSISPFNQEEMWSPKVVPGEKPKDEATEEATG